MEKVARNCGPKKQKGVYDGDGLNAVGFRVESPALLIIKLPDSRFLRIMSRSVFLAMFLLALPSLCTIMSASSGDDPSKPNGDSHGDNGFKSLPIVLRHFLDEGIIKKGHNGLIIEAGMRHIDDDLGFLRDAGIELLTRADLHSAKVAAHVLFDFVLASSFSMIQQIDIIVKDNGLVILPLGNDHSDGLRLLKHYKIVKLRIFDRTVVAMRKMRVSDTAKKGFGSNTPKEKRAALKGLEAVSLEPPTKVEASRRSAFTSRKIKFLPDLLKDSLDEYPRRIFISDDKTSLKWFYKHYPKRDQEFKVYSIDQAKQQHMGVSTWLKNKVRSADFVVMKAEAEVVEEMLRDKSLHLVDELFLQCNNQWQDAGKGNAGKRPYWQCVELYGKVIDEGIAVHQWWNRI